MVAVPSYLASDLVVAVRSESDLNNSQILSDQQIATIISDAGSSLRDIFTGTWQHYDVSTFAFSLVGGVGQNSVPLPVDFQQGHSVDVNPGTSQPYTLKYLTNWLERNRLSGSPFSFGGSLGGPREYYFLGSNPGELVVLPAVGSAGNFLLYYTPMWMPLAIPAVVTAQTASISIPCDGSVTGFSPSQFIAVNAPFLPTDVGNIVAIVGAVNSNNNGVFTVASVADSGHVVLSGTHTSETLPTTATATLLRQSRVSAAGVWTLYGSNPFSNSTINVKVGDVLVVAGTVNPGNSGSFVVTAADIGGNTITTAGAVGLVAENFNSSAITFQVQPQGTRPDLPASMNPWILYLKTMACITIRNKRGQDVEAFMARLQVDQQRIEKILAERQEEPQQPPLTRGSGYGWGGAGGF